MALSDRDKEILSALEANLSSSDPHLTSIMDGQSPSFFGTISFKINIFLTFIGMAIIFSGLIMKNSLIGVAGFLLALYGFQALIFKMSTIYVDSSGAKITKTKRSISNDLSKRLEERWDKRGFDN